MDKTDETVGKMDKSMQDALQSVADAMASSSGEGVLGELLKRNTMLEGRTEKLLDQNVALGEQNEALRAKIDEPRVGTPCALCMSLEEALYWCRQFMFDREWVSSNANAEQRIARAAEIDDLLKGE